MPTYGANSTMAGSSGLSVANSTANAPPMLCPTTMTLSHSRWSASYSASAASRQRAARESFAMVERSRPWPGSKGARTDHPRA